MVHVLFDSRSNAPRFGKFLSRVAPSVIKYTELDDDELRENALQALEAFVLRCPTEITPHIDTVVDLGLKFLRYDPNYDDWMAVKMMRMRTWRVITKLVKRTMTTGTLNVFFASRAMINST